MEFDYEILYRPGQVHQVPDALSRLLREGGAKDDATIDEEIPSFEEQHQVQPEQAHSVQVVTRARSGKAPSTGAANAAHANDNPPQVRLGRVTTVLYPDLNQWISHRNANAYCDAVAW